MRLEAFRGDPEGDVVRIGVVDGLPEKNCVWLCVVDGCGRFIGGGYIGCLRLDGLELSDELDPTLGFPLDDKGRIKLMNYP